MKKQIMVTSVLLVLFTFSTRAQKVAVEASDKAGWHKIVETSADLKLDRDEIMVTGKDHFKALKIKVTDVEVEFADVTVVFDNNEQESLPVRSLVKAGGETRAFDLKNNDQDIKKIILTYKTVPNAEKDKSHVEIWGLK